MNSRVYLTCEKADSYTNVQFPSKATEYMLVSVKDERNEIAETKMEIACMIVQWACKFWEVISLSFIMLNPYRTNVENRVSS